MLASTNKSMTNKSIRIHHNEKALLYELRQIFGVDYKKYGEYLRQDASVPTSIRKIYTVLGERRSYRRISDYFHRERESTSENNRFRLARKTSVSRRNSLDKSSRDSSTHGVTPEHGLHFDTDIDFDEDYFSDEQVDSPVASENTDESIETDYSIYMNASQTRSISPTDHHNQSEQPHFHRTYLTSKTSSLQSLRDSIQKALTELDQVVAENSAGMLYEHDDYPAQLSEEKINSLISERYHSKLDHALRTLSTTASQYQENTHSSTSDLSMTSHAEKTKESIQNVVERLNFLIDRGHWVYDTVENILSRF